MLLDAARVAFGVHQSRISAVLPGAEVRHIGGTSLPGLLTTGDVDVQIRVGRAEFESSKATLATMYEPLHPQSWTSDAAFFEEPGSQPHVEFALTVEGSLIDLHHGDAWSRIAADAQLIRKYNEIKRRYDHGDVHEYLAAKRDFFEQHFRL